MSAHSTSPTSPSAAWSDPKVRRVPASHLCQTPPLLPNKFDELLWFLPVKPELWQCQPWRVLFLIRKSRDIASWGLCLQCSCGPEEVLLRPGYARVALHLPWTAPVPPPPCCQEQGLWSNHLSTREPLRCWKGHLGQSGDSCDPPCSSGIREDEVRLIFNLNHPG